MKINSVHTINLQNLFLIICITPAIFAKQAETVAIGLMGDVMLGRTVNEKIGQTSFSYPWGSIRSLLKKNDLNLINLECALTTSTCETPKTFNFKANPDSVKTLTEGSITVTNLANNHILDFSYPGMNETVMTLDAAGIRHVGAGNNLQEAQRPTIINIKGLKIGIIGATDNEPGWRAGYKKPGVNFLYMNEPQRILKLIKKVKPAVDFLILSIHWGPNFREKPSRQFIDFAHKAIDAGVDILHGHSAHIIQPIEFYKGKIILYDTGDFVDDYAIDPILRNDEGCLFLITMSKEGIKSVQLVPTLIVDMQVNRASKKVASRIVKKINAHSKEFGTVIKDVNENYLAESASPIRHRN